MFATDKKLRTLVVARIEKTSNEASNNATEETKATAQNEDGEANGEGDPVEESSQFEIQFNLKV